MSLELKIVNSQIIFGYARNINIRKRVFDFEEKLSSSFKTPFKVISIPDEIDPNIPRFESSSKHGFSKLQVSQHRVNLSTGFNDKYSKENVSKYLKEKKAILTTLVKGEASEFVAYVMELHCIIPKEDINKILKDNSGANVIDDSLREFSISYSRLFKKNYFINVKCSKISVEEIIIENKTKKVTRKNHDGISVIVDLNSKPSFVNTGQFDESLYEDIDGLVFDVINNKSLEEFLQGNI
jgi:hypothetical protein